MELKQKLSESERAAWCAWLSLTHIGARRFTLLRNHFTTLLDAWNAQTSEIRHALQLEGKRLDELLEEKTKVNPDDMIPCATKVGAEVVTLLDEAYPVLLKEAHDAPPVLYVRGKLPDANELCLAVVGTRAFSNFGKVATPVLVEPLARAGLVIVSGLALGIDGLAHRATLAVNGKTIAVLGCGVDVIYPPQHKALADEIIDKGGAIISELPPGTVPQTHFFPLRNRIISGMSLGTLVIEAGEGSGALITAREALEENREVFAVPGDFTRPTALGPNQLIKMGAVPVTQAEDILNALDLKVQQTIPREIPKPANAEEEKLLQFLSAEPKHVDELAQLCDLDPSVINATLVVLELKGSVRHLGGLHYVLAT
jgi:DNA processing protein